MSDASRLNHYLTAWDLSNPRLLTQTMTSHIFTVLRDNETFVLKLLSPTETEEQTGALALAHFDGSGAVRLLRSDHGAQLLEYADGDELVTLVERGEDQLATHIIAQVIEQLHSVPQDVRNTGLVTLNRWFNELFQKAASDRKTGDNTVFVRGAFVAERLLADPRDVRVLHGDIHHRNIRESTRGWLAFDPKGLIGERAYDCANTLCNPAIPELVHNNTRLLTNATILADTLALDLSRILAFTYAYACLNASWWSESASAQNMVKWSLKIAAIVEPHIEVP